MKIVQQYSKNNKYYQRNVSVADSRYSTFQKRGPVALMLHSVGCPQPSAKVFADKWNKATAEVAVHAVLQADGTVIQCLPWNYRGIHAGGDANNTHVGVEMTEPSQIKYTTGAKFTCSNLAAARAQAEGCYKTAVELFAMLCKKYSLDPLTDICSHAEGYKKGIASGHGDPEHLWKGLGMAYTMDTFRKAVKAAMEPQTTHEETEEEPMTKEQILKELGDQYIAKFSDLPAWAKTEVRPLLDAGYIKGTDPDDPDDIGMFMSDIRTLIVCARIMGK